MVFLRQGGESRGSNDRAHGISCRYLDKACKKINYISTNTYSIFMQKSAHLFIIPGNHSSKYFFLQSIVIFRRSPSKVEILKTIFVRTCVENNCIQRSNFEMNVCFE